ncbi:endonuclease domain-containing protein [Ursidibacter sp. B-7004-1]
MAKFIKRKRENYLRDRAKQLRSNMTDEERILWEYLRAKRFCHIKFHRQKIIGCYIVDFVCLSHKLIIELDGSQHLEQEDYDKQRTLFLNQQGFDVLRFWNKDVHLELDRVLDTIFYKLHQPSL